MNLPYEYCDDFSQGARKGLLGDQYYGPKIPRDLLDTTAPLSGVFNSPAGRNIGPNEGRLNDKLRAAASDPRPLYSLGLAAYEFAKALFLGQTGHSLDNERRTYFARQIIEFLGLQ